MLGNAARRVRDAAAALTGRSARAHGANPEVRQLEVLVRGILERDYGGDLLPPEELRLHVGTKVTAANFWAQGSNSAQRVIKVFGKAPEGLVLDWGCGSGRTLNWLKRTPAWRQNWRGCDVDASAIAWLNEKGFDGAVVSGDMPPLPYDDNTFAGLYAFSVLTHIPPERHRAWYEEIRRVLRPGGRAYLTTQGEGVVAAGRIPADATDAYRRTGAAYVVSAGHYKDAALVSEAFTRAQLSDGFEVLRYKRDGYQNMDAFLLRKR